MPQLSAALRSLPRATPTPLPWYEMDADPRQHRVTVRLRGTADRATTPPMASVLDGAHAEAVRLGVREVEVDLRSLSFMSVACFERFMTWVRQVELLEPSQRYQIVFLTDARSYWQRRGLMAIASYAREIVRIEP